MGTGGGEVPWSDVPVLALPPIKNCSPSEGDWTRAVMRWEGEWVSWGGSRVGEFGVAAVERGKESQRCKCVPKKAQSEKQEFWSKLNVNHRFVHMNGWNRISELEQKKWNCGGGGTSTRPNGSSRHCNTIHAPNRRTVESWIILKILS